MSNVDEKINFNLVVADLNNMIGIIDELKALIESNKGTITSNISSTGSLSGDCATKLLNNWNTALDSSNSYVSILNNWTTSLKAQIEEFKQLEQNLIAKANSVKVVNISSGFGLNDNEQGGTNNG